MNDMNDNTIQRMEKILISPNKSKKNTLEKIVIVFSCMIMGGLILIPFFIFYFIFQFNLYFVGLFVSSICTIIVKSGFTIYHRYLNGIEDIYEKPRKSKEKLSFKEYLKKLKPNIFKDLLICLSSGILILIVCSIIMIVLLLFNFNDLTIGVLNGFTLVSIMMLVIDSYKKEIKDGTRSLIV